jgi:hypothetical protein
MIFIINLLVLFLININKIYLFISKGGNKIK